MSLWDQVRVNMSDWYAVAADKTEEMARIGVRKYDKFTISRDIERALTDLGSHVYTSVREGRTDFAHDATVQGAVERLRLLEHQLELKEQEIAAIRAAARPLPAAPAAARAPVANRNASPDAIGPGHAGPGLEAGEPDDADVEASLDPQTGGGDGPGSDPWDDEIALWNEPLDLDEEPGEGDGSAGDSRTHAG